MLQAGLKAQVMSVEREGDDDDCKYIFTLYVSDKVIAQEMKKRTINLVIPLLLFAL